MSSATSSSPSVAVEQGSTRLLGAALRRILASVRAVTFWAAALLPLVTLVLLFAGVASQSPAALGGLLALNAVCAVVGHGHSPGR